MSSRLLDRFHDLSQAHGLDYLIIGGYAASFWGTPRFTADIDFAIEKAQLDVLKEIASQLHYRLAFLHPKKAFAHFVPPSPDAFRIDVMLVDSNTWKKLSSEKDFGDFGGREPYPVVSPIHLIAMKLHSASQKDRTEFRRDLQDIVSVMREQQISYEFLEENGILNKHGNEKIVQLLKQYLDEP